MGVTDSFGGGADAGPAAAGIGFEELHDLVAEMEFGGGFGDQAVRGSLINGGEALHFVISTGLD